MDDARRAAPPLFLHPLAFSALAGETAGRAALPLEHGFVGRGESGSDLAGVARANGRSDDRSRADRGDFLAGNALLYGQHTIARHGLGEHGALAGGACAAT